MPEQSMVPTEHIERVILVLRGHKVIIDKDLAALYGVETKILNRAVKRNIERFPADFMFQLTEEEAAALRFRFGTSNVRGGRRYIPYATLVRELPWSANLHILSGTKKPEEREFYLRLATRNRWNVRELARQIDSALFERTALAPPKLSTTLREIHPARAGLIFQPT